MFWDGKLSILRSSFDLGMFSLLLSLLLSTIFSKDINSSIWGVDGRLGGGILVFISILLVTICSRTFIKEEKDISNSIMIFLLGMLINNILSIFSFLGINIWGLIPVYKDLHQYGLPLVRSSKVHLLLNIVSIFMSIFLAGEYLIEKKKESRYILSLIILGVSVLNIWIYSIKQGWSLVLVAVIVLTLFAIFVLKRIKLQANVSKNIFLFILIAVISTAIPTILLQIPAITKLVIPESMNIVSQISLGADVSWIIAASVFVESFVRGIFGMGVDTYSISYYLYKPLNVNLIAFNNVTFYYAGSEVFTQFANGGLVWLLVWFFFGFLILRSLLSDIKDFKTNSDHMNIWRVFMLDILLLVIYISSFLSVYSIIITFILLSLISMRAILVDRLRKNTEDRFVFKFWAVNQKVLSGENKSLQNINIFLTIVVSCISLVIFGFWTSKSISSIYVLKAESFFVQESNKYGEGVNPTLEEREKFVDSMAYYYSQASKFDGNNPLYSRKQGLMYLERVGIAAERYSDESSDQESMNQIIRDVGVWKNYVIDSTRKSIDISPNVYSNWEARSRVYLGLVGMGFYDYTPDAVFSLEKAIELNPLNFELHYSMAQAFIIKGEKDSALASLTKVLGINPQHIPSILLAGEINKEKGNIDIYESYLTAAKKILETQGNTNVDVYDEISKQLNSLNHIADSSEEEVSE